MLTFFTTCCPFRKKGMNPMTGAPLDIPTNRYIIQRNAIGSWTKLNKDCEIIIFGKEEGIKEITKKFNIKHDTQIEYLNEHVPFVKSLFERAEKIAEYDLLCYINSDIILVNNFLPAVQRVTKNFKQFLAVGQRWDIDISKGIDFDDSAWKENILKIVKEKGKLHKPAGMDYFIFPKGIWKNIPNFALARAKFDNWLMWDAINRSVPTIDMTLVTTVIHQNHEKNARVRFPDEFGYNSTLGGGKMRDTCHSKWILTKDGLKERCR